MTTNPAHALIADLPRDPLVFPHQLDLLRDQVVLIRLTAEIEARHSFLDQRILTRSTLGATIPWEAFERAASAAPPGAPGYIFHLGHCGSTLVSRLVSEAADAAGLREPLVLRTLAFDLAEGSSAFLDPSALRARLGAFERLFARGGKPAVVKATSICNDLVPLVAPASAKVFVYQSAPVHIALTLAADNAKIDLRGFAPMRRRRLGAHGLTLDPLSGLHGGPLAAMVWLAETVSARRGLNDVGLIAFDFDAVLARPAENLSAICAALLLHRPSAASLRSTARPCAPILRPRSIHSTPACAVRLSRRRKRFTARKSARAWRGFKRRRERTRLQPRRWRRSAARRPNSR